MKTRRLDVIDLLRGIIIVIMALDHVRDFFHSGHGHDPLDLDVTHPALFFTRWVTHFCAPTFVFLAGVSAWLQAARGKTGWPLSRFLLTRGLWLLVLEGTVVAIGWEFWHPLVLVLQVIWAIGLSMMVLGLLCWLPVNAVLAIGILILVGHNLLDPITRAQLGSLGNVWRAVHEGGALSGAPVRTVIAYPVLPWIGILCFGYGFGRVFLLETAARQRTLHRVGWGMIAAFLALRGLDWYGDPGHWHAHDVAWKTAGDFLDVKKYPPSLQYVLMTLGPVLALLPWLERARGPVADFFLAFGRAPLFAYVLHIYLAHGLSLLLGVAEGHPVATYVNPLFEHVPDAENWGLALPGTYAAWAVVVALLYLPTRWFAGIKARRKDWWLSYL